MKRNRLLIWVLTFLPSLMMLGSLALMNDGDSTSRRGMLSVFLLLLGVGQMVLFAFFVGFLPESNGLALRLGALFFLLFAAVFMLRMTDRYMEWISVIADDDVARLRVILSVIGGLASAGLFLLGFGMRYRKRKQMEEDL